MATTATGVISAFSWANGVVSGAGTLTGITVPANALSSFGQDAAGEVYVVDIEGSVYRIDPA